MPNRIIKESICTSDSIDNLTWFEEVLFYRLIVNCDDFGRYDGRPAIIKNRLFPLKDFLPLYEVANALGKLENAHLITMYEHDGKPFLYLNTWDEHQRIRAKRSKYPQPSDNTCCQMTAFDSKLLSNASVIQSNPIQSESESESKRKEVVQRNRFTPPSLDEVKAYCDERKNNIDPQAFIDFYTSKGWKIGKETMKDWKAAVRTWERREDKQPQQPQKKKQFTTASDYKAPSQIDVNALNKIKDIFGGLDDGV